MFVDNFSYTFYFFSPGKEHTGAKKEKIILWDSRAGVISC